MRAGVTRRSCIHRRPIFSVAMWAAESWAPMESGKPACWERRRDAPHRRLKPEVYFEQAENGTFCKTNWYEGHAGRLGQPELLPDYDAFAQPCWVTTMASSTSALLWWERRGTMRRRPADVISPGTSHGAASPRATTFSIWSAIGCRITYVGISSGCWRAVSGKLPGQQPRDRSIRLANSPKLLDVDPLRHRRAGGAGRQPVTRGATLRAAKVESGRFGYSLPDIFTWRCASSTRSARMATSCLPSMSASPSSATFRTSASRRSRHSC